MKLDNNVGKSSKLSFASENIVGNSEYKTNDKIAIDTINMSMIKGARLFKTCVTESCIFCFHRIKNFLPQNAKSRQFVFTPKTL